VLAIFPQHSLTQDIGIKLAGFCKLDNPFGDSFPQNALVAKLKSCASHFECHAQRMVAEKITAIAEAQAAAVTKMIMGGGMAAATKSASAVYRRKVRANQRRLSLMRLAAGGALAQREAANPARDFSALNRRA